MNYSSGTSGLIEVGISLVLKDKFTDGALKANTAVRQLNNEAKRAVNANIQAANQINNMVMTAAAASVGVMADAILNYGKEYVDTMTTVKAISDATQVEMESLSETALNLGMQTMFASQDVASGMKYLAMAGNSAQEINDIIKGATYSAAATGLALGGKGGAADMLTNVMRAFKLHGKEAADTLADQLTKATLSANISMQDLAESIKYSAADMVSLGRTVPEVAAMIGTLGNAGIQGSMAGTALSNMSRYFLKAITGNSQKGAKALESLGIKIQDITNERGDLIDMASILIKIQRATANMTSVERTGIFQVLFGARGFRAANALMNDLQGFIDLQSKIMESQGFAARITEERMKTIAGAINLVKSAWENLKVSFTQAISPMLTPLLKSLAKMLTSIGKFLSTGFGKFVAKFALISSVVTLIGTGIVKLRLMFKTFANDGMISAGGMFRVLVSGWKASTISAKEYAKWLQWIRIYQSGVLTPKQLAAMGPWGIYGTGGKMGKAIRNMGAPTSVWMRETRGARQYAKTGGVKPVPKPKYKGGSLIVPQRQWVQNRAANGRFASGFKSVRYSTSARVGGTIGNMGRAVGYGARVAGRAAGGALRGIGTALGGALSFLGGPWGLIAMAAVTLISQLPNIIDSISRSVSARRAEKEAIERNTAAANTLAGRFETEAQRRAAGMDLSLREELILLHNAIVQMTNLGINVSLRNESGAPLTITDVQRVIREEAQLHDLSNGTRTLATSNSL